MDLETCTYLPKSSLEDSSHLEQFCQNMNTYLKIYGTALEAKMFDKFYTLRVEQSRRSIDCIGHINKSWKNFVECSKSIAAQRNFGNENCALHSVSQCTSLTTVSVINNK